MRIRKPGEQTGSMRTSGSTLLAFAFVAVPILMLLSCYPGEISNIEELDTVGTIYDPNVDYSAFSTYAMPDSVVAIDNRESSGDEPPLSPAFQALMLSTVASNMEKLGYTRVCPDGDASVCPDPSKWVEADVAVTVGIIISDEFVASIGYPWGGYWGWYGGWPGYGPGYGIGYPPTGTVYKYETGTAVIDMIDIDSSTPSDSLVDAIWQGGINGLASSKQAVNEDRIIKGINQAFEQSPYLKSSASGVQ
jgi:hypothetical protein